MNSVALRKTLACVLAVATIGTSSVLPIAPSVFNTGIVASAASNTVKYKYKTVSGGVMFLGYADPTYDKDDNEQLHYPSGTTMDIPASISGKSVVSIGKLENVDDFKSVCKTINIPASVTTIADNVFEEFDSVTTVTFKGTAITSIGANAFSGCSSLKSIDFKNANTLTIGKGAFEECSALKTVKAGAGGVIIKESAFEGLESLTTVDLNANAKASTIGANAFADSGVTKVTLPKLTSSIGASAFEGCYRLATVNLGELTKLTTINANTFASTALLNIEIPSAIIFIKDNAFAEINNEDEYGDPVASTLTFKNADAKIKASANAFDGTEITSVKVPANMYNTKAGIIAASTFGNVHELIVTSKTQKVTGVADLSTDDLKVKSPFGSYIWACVQKTKYEDSESGQPTYIKFKDTLESNDGTNGKYTYTSVTLKQVSSNTADGVNVKYTTPIAKSDVNNGAGAKDLVATVNTGVTTWTLNSVSLIKKLFNYTDTIASNGLSGTFVIKTKSGSGIALSSDISSTYDIQAENFDSADITFDTTTDAKNGIYNSTYKCYVASSETAAVKPTVIVKIGNKVVDKKYYTVTYKNNTGIRANNGASLTVALNDAGKKLYNTSKTFNKSFTIKMDINKVKLGLTTFINPGNTDVVEGQPGILTDDASKSAFKSVGVSSEPGFAASNDYLVCMVKLNASDKTSTLRNKTDKVGLTVEYDSNYFYHNEEFGNGLPIGIVEGKIKTDSSPYFFGERNVEYYTKFNLDKYNDIYILNAEGDAVNVVGSITQGSGDSKITFDRAKDGYTYTGKAITLGGFSLKVKNNLLVSELPATAYTTTYAKNINASSSYKVSNLAYVDIKASNKQTYIFGTKRIYFKINPKTLDDSIISNIPNVTYNGEKINPTITGYYNGVELRKGTDFNVDYGKEEDNVNPGTGTVKVTGIGNYSGTLTKKFTINKANLSSCKVSWQNDTVSWRFGFAINPVPVVKFKETVLTRGVDYNLVYLGKYKSTNTYTGASPTNVGDKGAVAIVPCSSSKIISTSTSGLTKATYGNNSTTGIVKEYTVGKLNLANVDFTYRRDLVSNTYDQFKYYLIPNIVINGQTLKAYTPNEVRALVYKVKYKNKGAYYRTYYDIPYNESIVAYYGTETSNGTGFNIAGKMVRETEKENIENSNGINYPYYLVQDRLYMKDRRGNMAQVSKFYYTSVYDNAHPERIDDAMGIKVDKVTYNQNGVGNTTWMVKPGIIHVYTTGSVESENRSMLTSDTATGLEHAWDIYVRPGKAAITPTNFNIQDNKPKTLNIRFSPSNADTFNGDIYYKVRLYKTASDAKNNTNALASYSIRYKNNDATQATKNLTVTRNGRYLYYEYTINNVPVGYQLYANVIAYDNKTKVASPIYEYPQQYLTTTNAASIKSAYYSKNKDNDSNYDMTVKMQLPKHTIGTSASKAKISNIYYEISIHSSSGNTLTTYKVSEDGIIDNKYDAAQKLTCTDKTNRIYAIKFESVPGMNDNSNYYVRVRTYMYFFTGNYTSNTYKFECTKDLSGIRVGSSAVEAYRTDRGSISVTTDKSVVNNSTVAVTAHMVNFTAKDNVANVIVYDEANNQVYTKNNLTLSNNKITAYNIPASVFNKNTGSAVTYRIVVTAKQEGTSKTITGNHPITVMPSIVNNSYVLKNKSSDGKIHINPKGQLPVVLAATDVYSNSDSGIYSVTVDYYGNDSTYRAVQSSEAVLSEVQKTNNTSYVIRGNSFEKLGYYRVSIKLYDDTELGKTKTFDVYVVDEPMNTSTASIVSGYIEDGVFISVGSTKMTNVSYLVNIYMEGVSNAVASKTITSSAVIALGSNAISGKKYYATVTAKGTYNGASKSIGSGRLDIGELINGEMLNTSTVSRTEVLQGWTFDYKDGDLVASEDGKITVNLSSKYGGFGATTYEVTMTNVATGNSVEYTPSGNKVVIDVNKKSGTAYVLPVGTYELKIDATKNGKTESLSYYVRVKNINSWFASRKLNGTGLGDNSVLTVNSDNIFNITTASTGMEVRLEYKRTTNKKWVELNNKSEEAKEYSFNLKPNSEGTFDVRVTLIDAYGKILVRTYKLEAKK